MHRLLIALCLFLAGCAETQEHPNQVGRLQNSGIREASGLARSNIDPDRLWIINDGGAGPELFAIGVDGSNQGVFRVAGSRNLDWEDLASFVLDGQPMLLIADIGDNLARRQSLTLYVLREPTLTNAADDIVGTLEIAWQLNFVFPDGAIDAESVSVDAEKESVLILSKREIPAVLYQVPLRPRSGNPVTAATATRIGAVESLPQPSKLDRDRALARQDWHWQPTAMDISASGSAAVILTYRGIYLYQRANNQSWFEALQGEPEEIEMSGVKEAESITFSADEAAVFVTTEKRHPPLLRFEIRENRHEEN
jgi:hypothetical protein